MKSFFSARSKLMKLSVLIALFAFFLSGGIGMIFAHTISSGLISQLCAYPIYVELRKWDFFCFLRSSFSRPLANKILYIV
ncbi:MAG: hypothetical protein LBH34_02595 [Prevotellaceae bacterium]|nr:hypothetical protein [Prevotellaceae bacterium]